MVAHFVLRWDANRTKTASVNDIDNMPSIVPVPNAAK
jgi:hypothetical protein